jgi:glycosyltransferase involved in cell wall biosynthesis
MFRNVGFYSDEKKLSYLYSAADLFVVTSRNENLPNTIIESMSCGTPTIAFDVGGISDIIDDNVDGLLINKFDTELFARSIKMYFQNESMRNQMHISARNKVLRSFDIRKVAKMYIKLYVSILKKVDKQYE